MPEIKKSSKPHVPIVFLKWLVTVLSVVMILGFLFLVTILGIKIANFNKTQQPVSTSSISDVLISEGEVESINIKDDLLTIVVKVSEGYLEVSVLDIKDGILLNQFFIKQKKSLYNE
ncbi:DUF6476 family protein [Paracoccaceae bacterium]|nr:DUF6476 family protein [Paracoccaceae bacterium]